jgi:D-alanine transaminase
MRSNMSTPLPDTLCYLNGEYLPLNEAKISVLDRGFIFGDGVYDVVPVYGRRLFRFDEHMARLERGLHKIRIPTRTPRAVAGALPRLVARCTRRPAPRTRSSTSRSRAAWRLRDHVMPVGIEPTVFMMANPMKPPTAEQRHHGVACVTARDFRWERGDIKSISLLGNVLARQMSADHGALETIMFRDGHLTEAAASNVWIVHEGALARPAEERACARRHPRRAAARAVRGGPASPTTCARSPRPTCAPPTRCCSARPPRRCCR